MQWMDMCGMSKMKNRLKGLSGKVRGAHALLNRICLQQHCPQRESREPLREEAVTEPCVIRRVCGVV